MSAWYNEIDPYAAQWLRNLIEVGHIAKGDVDERSIVDVAPADLAGYTQCHFFAGIGGWSLALRLAGWPDDRPVWTGSCPCQPLSGAGQRKGHADERHLWPAFHRLISECRPAIVLGEQVAGTDGREWFAAVRADLEADGYACGGADLCAAGVGAPHIRQRLYWVADAEHAIGRPLSVDGQDGCDRQDGGRQEAHGEPRARSEIRRMGFPDSGGSPPGREAASSMGHRHPTVATGGRYRPGPADGFWSDADWLLCRDGRWRPVEPGTSPLAHGVPGRVGRLRAYGNAIVPQVAAAFVGAFMEALP